MTPAIFQPKSRMDPAFTCAVQDGRFEHHLQVFQWEDRLVARAEASGLWWATLDAWDGRYLREFWNECVDSERVGRLFSQRRGFSMGKENGATLLTGKQLFHVIVAQDNSGLARVEEELQWHPFAPVEPSRVRNSKAHRPTIWSRNFHTQLVRRAMVAFDNDVVVHLPTPLGSLWEQGANARPLRLIATARVLGWAKITNRPVTIPQFWKSVWGDKSSAKDPRSLPTVWLESAEVALPGEIHWNRSLSNHRVWTPALFWWQSADTTLNIKFGNENHSAQEYLEARLELRDWLRQFFSRREVGSWFRE